ncbi:MAG: SPASM domain-containing protein, partial [Candidatus Hodarchaeota archaeon]
VIFTGGGEPLKNQYTIPGMKWAKEHGLSVGLFTNGFLLTEEVASKIAQINPTFIRISLNAGSPEAYRLSYGLSRKENYLQMVLGNIEYIARAKQQSLASPDKRFHLDIGVLITPFNIGDLAEIAFQLKRIALRYRGTINNIAFRPAVNYGRDWYGMSEDAMRDAETLLKTFPFVEGVDLVSMLRNFIQNGMQLPEQAITYADNIIRTQLKPILLAGDDDGTINVSLPSERLFNVSQNVHPQRCLAYPLVVFIGPDTSVYHCVERALDPNMSYGKLSEASLKELWESPKRKDIMSKLGGSIESECPPVCLLYEYNKVFNAIQASLKDNTTSERCKNNIDLAQQRFKDVIAPRIGEVVNFI